MRPVSDVPPGDRARAPERLAVQPRIQAAVRSLLGRPRRVPAGTLSASECALPVNHVRDGVWQSRHEGRAFRWTLANSARRSARSAAIRSSVTARSARIGAYTKRRSSSSLAPTALSCFWTEGSDGKQLPDVFFRAGFKRPISDLDGQLARRLASNNVRNVTQEKRHVRWRPQTG